jgi:glycosyltransferase involved in cell wall biosynthesis
MGAGIDMTFAEIVIPCYNESNNINLLFNECKKVIAESNFKIKFIIVDNGSTDDTSRIIDKLENLDENIKFVHLFPNKGYGGGIIEGLKTTRAPLIGWTHADLQTPIKDCLIGVQFLSDRYSLVKGYRIGRPKADSFFSKGMELFESKLFGFKLKEINAQPTLMKRDIFENWQDPPTDFSLDLYALVMAGKHNIEVKRFNVTFLPRQFGNSKWNLGIKSRIKFISRVIKYSFDLKRVINEDL